MKDSQLDSPPLAIIMQPILLNPLNSVQNIKLLILKIKTLALLCAIFLHGIYLEDGCSRFSLETFWPALKVAQHIWAKFVYSISIFSLVICRKVGATHYWVANLYRVTFVFYGLSEVESWSEDKPFVQDQSAKSVRVRPGTHFSLFKTIVLSSDQRMYGPTSSPVFVNTVLLTHSHSHLFMAVFSLQW